MTDTEPAKLVRPRTPSVAGPNRRWALGRVCAALLLLSPALACACAAPGSMPRAEPKGRAERAPVEPNGRAEPAPVEPAPVELTIVETYTGRVHLPSARPGGPFHEPSPRVIRSAAAWSDFVSMIPTEQVAMKQPAKPSDDPLLTMPMIDFDQQMWVVVFRGESMYVPPTLENPRVVDDTLLLDVGWPALGETAHAAAPSGVGTYCAEVLPRFDGEVEFIGAERAQDELR